MVLKIQNFPTPKVYKPKFRVYSMVFKINIGTKTGKTYKLEGDFKFLIDKAIGDKFEGKELQENLEGYEFEIAGASDKSGFMASPEVEGAGIKRVLLTYGKGMHKRPKREGKKNQSTPRPKGLRLRKTLRGKMISEDIRQINLKIAKFGKTTIDEVFNPKTEEPKTEEKAE